MQTEYVEVGLRVAKELRLQKIRQANTSASALLDNRQLQPLEPIEARMKANQSAKVRMGMLLHRWVCPTHYSGGSAASCAQECCEHV
jgi:hypothetical protein